MTNSSTPRTARRAALLAAAAIAATVPVIAQTAPADAATFQKGTVHADGGLVGHLTPSRYSPRNYVFRNGSRVTIDCRVPGTSVGGNRTWYLVVAEGDANWVSGRYVTMDGPTKLCTTDGIDAKATKTAPLREGASSDDVRTGTLQSGSHLVVRCSTGQHVAGDPTMQRWVLTEKGNWVRRGAIDPDARIPYCSQTG